MGGALPDHWARKSFPWDHPQRWDLDALTFHKAVIALRRSNPALQSGDYIPLYADTDVYAFARTLQGSTIITAVNVAGASRQFTISLSSTLPAQPGMVRCLMTTGGSPTAELAPGTVTLTVPSRSGAVFDASPDSRNRA